MNIAVKTYKDFDRPDIREISDDYFLPAPEILGAGKDLNSSLLILSNALGFVNNLTVVNIRTPVETVFVIKTNLCHVVEKRIDARERYSNFIIPTLEDPFEIYSLRFQSQIRNQYIGLFRCKHNILVSVSTNQSGEPIFWNMMQSGLRTMNKHRRGELIWAKKMCSPVIESTIS